MKEVFRKLEKGNIAFMCIGCDEMHVIPIEGNNAWGFNGDYEKPTLTPSIKVSADFDGRVPKRICHSFVTDGEIKYLNDCTHELKGQTIKLPIIKK